MFAGVVCAVVCQKCQNRVTAESSLLSEPIDYFSHTIDCKIAMVCPTEAPNLPGVGAVISLACITESCKIEHGCY